MKYDFIKSTGNAEKYLTDSKAIDIFGGAMMIIAADKVSEYLTPEKIKEYDLNSYNIKDLIKTTGNIEKIFISRRKHYFKTGFC